MIGGDDFKSGQTKMKSVMVDFLVSIGLGLGLGLEGLLTYHLLTYQTYQTTNHHQHTNLLTY